MTGNGLFRLVWFNLQRQRLMGMCPTPARPIINWIGTVKLIEQQAIRSVG